jgi:hypothetical protein
MRKMYIIHQIVSWAIAIFLAWLIGRGILWTILEFLVRYNIANYDAKRALYGMSLLVILSLTFSTIRDAINKNETNYVIDNIRESSRANYFELIVFGSRIALTGYIFTYWINQGSFLLEQRDIIIVPDLFPVLLALGAAVVLTIAISAYLIILEPWRVVISWSNFNLKHERATLFIGRSFSLLVVNSLLYWFWIPELETKLPSMLVFVCCLIVLIALQILHHRSHTSDSIAE